MQCPRSSPGPCSGHGAPVPTGGRVLQIPLVRAEDAGRYSCKASNEVGEDWLHYELVVLSEWQAWGQGLGSAGAMRASPERGHGGEHVQSGCTWMLIMWEL